MIKLKDLITELAWVDKTFKQVHLLNIPISIPIMKKVIGDVTVSAFHMTELDYVVNGNVKKSIGTKKSLSTFTAITQHSDLARGKGIQTGGGILFHVEGKLLISANQDIGSGVDESGRRWLNVHLFDGLLGNIKGKWKLQQHMSKNKTWADLHEKAKAIGYVQDDGEFGTMTNKEKQQYIKIYIDEITKLMVKNKKTITDKFGTKALDTGPYNWFEWNETVVSNIKIKDVLVIQDNSDIYTWMNRGFNVKGVRTKLTRKDIDKYLKKVAKGATVWGGARDVISFVEDRGGTIE